MLDEVAVASGEEAVHIGISPEGDTSITTVTAANVSKQLLGVEGLTVVGRGKRGVVTSATAMVPKDWLRSVRRRYRKAEHIRRNHLAAEQECTHSDDDGKNNHLLVGGPSVEDVHPESCVDDIINGGGVIAVKLGIKEYNAEAKVNSIPNEAAFLHRCNVYLGVGPLLLAHSARRVVYAFVEGVPIVEFLKLPTTPTKTTRGDDLSLTANGQKAGCRASGDGDGASCCTVGDVARVIRDVLCQCRAMDAAGFSKGEMQWPNRHVLVQKKLPNTDLQSSNQRTTEAGDHRVGHDTSELVAHCDPHDEDGCFDVSCVLIDFERCKATNRPQNVTQFCEFIFMPSLLPLLLEKRGSRGERIVVMPRTDVRVATIEYVRSGYSEEAFRVLLEGLIRIERSSSSEHQ